MSLDKLKQYCFVMLAVLGTALGAYVFLRHVFIVVLPFLIAWFAAFALRPVSLRVSHRLHLPVGVTRLIISVLALVTVLGAAGAVIWLVSREVWQLLVRVSEDGTVESFISGIADTGGILGDSLGGFGTYVAEGLYDLAMSALTVLGGWISSIASAVPRVLFFVLITLIATVYFALELEHINSTVCRLLPEGVYRFAVRLKDGFITSFVKYIRSYLIILLITFFEMLLGLFIIGADYPLLMAALIAALDILPVIGVGTILIPWSILCFVRGLGGLGAALLILFAVHTIIRQMIEPKIVGRNLGVHPVLTLVLIYVGYSLFGIVGLMLVPILSVLVNICLGKDDAAQVGEGQG